MNLFYKNKQKTTQITDFNSITCVFSKNYAMLTFKVIVYLADNVASFLYHLDNQQRLDTWNFESMWKYILKHFGILKFQLSFIYFININ